MERATQTAVPTENAVLSPQPNCLNCGTVLTGNFCAECGQQNKFHTVSLGPLLSDMLAEAASWDSRLLRTIRLLLTQPGFLTNEYIAGRIVPYLSPLKLYLTVSVLFFLLLTWINPLTNAVVISSSGLHTTYVWGPPKARTVNKTNFLFEGQMVTRLLKAKQNKLGFVNALLNGIPRMMFVLLPAFAVLLKLLYLRTKRLYVEHVVFLLHVHAFGYLVLSPMVLLHSSLLTSVVALAIMAYVLIAMKAVYRQSWRKTNVKFVILGVGYAIIFALCSLGTTIVALWLL